MLQRASQWRLLAIAGGLLLVIVYLYGLDRMGMYSADEPRYASIGREMARTGDFITPRLWGQPWFEKPPLLYWMVAAGFRAGLSEDLAPRLPVALLSVGFLIAFFWMVRREFGEAPSAYSTIILATAGGWIALSDVAITDIPMSAMFGLALLFAMRWLHTWDRRWLNASAVALGAAFLAKSAPPLVLGLPVLWFGRERWRDLIRPTPVLLFLLIALPWHVACFLRNGPIFLRTLFWQQQIERFISPSLQHVQPWWFYIPLLPAAFFPWTPLLALLFRREIYADKRLQFLLATAVWTIVFFSASTNKLPGYLLPLMPPLAVVAGVAVERAQLAGRIAIIASALLCSGFPVLIARLPIWMSRNPQAAAPAIPLSFSMVALLLTAAVFFIRNRALSLTLVGLLAAFGYLWIKVETFPYIDLFATARPIGQQIRSAGDVCVKDVPRDWYYGLNYYADRAVPYCPGGVKLHSFVYFRDHRLKLELAPR